MDLTSGMLKNMNASDLVLSGVRTTPIISLSKNSIAVRMPLRDHSSEMIDVMVLDGESGLALKVVRSLALSPRWRIHVIGLASETRWHPIACSVHLASFHILAPDLSEDGFVWELMRIVRQTRAALVVPILESTSLVLIRNRAKLETLTRLALLPEETDFRAAIDKYSLARVMTAGAIPHPPTHAWNADGYDLKFPQLIKPRRSSGGQGIVKVTSREELAATRAIRSPESYFFQDYIEGDDYGCSVLAEKGRLLAWTVQRGVGRMSAYAPSLQLQMQNCEPVLAVTRRLMAELRWSGVANVDFRLDRRTGQPLVLEVNGRYWATLFASTIAEVNFPDLACRSALGELIPGIIPQTRKFSALKPFVWDLLRFRRKAFRPQITDLPFILRDPLPELAKLWQRPWRV